MMVNLETVDFPSRYLACYEAVLMTTLKYMGLPEETPLMGTQAYFVLVEDKFDVSPRFNGIVNEWKRIHSLEIETAVAVNEADLRDQILSRLDHNTPVSLPLDIYTLPFTPHYGRLHQGHFVGIFGWRHNSYYIVCPYYRFKGWLGDQLVHGGFFSSVIPEIQRYITFITAFQLGDLSSERCENLVRESCQYMLGLSVPSALCDVLPTRRGLAGIRTFSTFLKDLTTPRYQDLSNITFLELSRKTLEIGYSRYWFHRFIQTYCPRLLTSATSPGDLEARFKGVVDLWRAAGMRVAARVYSDRPEEIDHAALNLEKVYCQEEPLFNLLLGVLSNHEVGTL